jgi:hypothetical protein
LKRGILIAAAALLAAFIAIQFVPVRRVNRMGSGDPPAPREVMFILRRSCYDCHSTESRWPIWAYIAPMSWRVVADVNKARLMLNFSDWSSYDTLTQRVLRENVNRVTATHRMPVWYYLTLHPDAKLSDADRRVLGEWSRARPGAVTPR